ncbi:MAG TPA: hypothetical protein VM779_10360 [Thermoanaerobaculia bacterium]|nr:hypothetical protein [Thermoanaerobaculia bacterium]
MERRRAVKWWCALAVSAVIVTTGPAMMSGNGSARQAATVLGTLPAAIAAAEPAIEAETIALTAAHRDELAAEMSRWLTRHPRQLVDTIAELAESQPLPLPPTFLLSIAWAETRGKILAVSPAGAAGLAQATPAAYLLEGFDGKLYVTNQYLIGTRNYIMKKPLGDAMEISDRLLKRNTPATRTEARKLLVHAIELRQEGMDELEALRPVANDYFFARIAEADERNLATLRELGRLIDRGAPLAATKSFNDRVRKDYREMMNVQRVAWARYGKQLEARRDALLRAHFKQDPTTVILTRPYTAGEYLGEVLDARFSPTQMASFLAAHLGTKQKQALELGLPPDTLDAWTAALYNGGAVNVKRMRAGLIGTLTETQKYMQLVPARSARLERAMG